MSVFFLCACRVRVSLQCPVKSCSMLCRMLVRFSRLYWCVFCVHCVARDITHIVAGCHGVPCCCIESSQTALAWCNDVGVSVSNCVVEGLCDAVSLIAMHCHRFAWCCQKKNRNLGSLIVIIEALSSMQPAAMAGL